MPNVTEFLLPLDGGDPKAAEQLLPLVYEELRRLVAHKMANEVPGQTLQPAALVHEAWLRLSQQSRAESKPTARKSPSLFQPAPRGNFSG